MDWLFLDYDAAATDASGAKDCVLASEHAPTRQNLCAENLALAVWQTAESRSSHPAVQSRGQSINYDWIRAAASHVRDHLLACPDFRPGMRAVVAMENSPEYLAAFYGVLLA